MKAKTQINHLRCMEWGLTTTQAVLMDYLFTENFPIVTEKPQLKILYRSNVLFELPVCFREIDTVYRTLKALQKKGLIQLYLNAGGTYEDWFAVTDKGLAWGKYE